MKLRCLLLFFLMLITGLLKSQTLIPFTDGNRWGYCNSEKKVVIPLQYYFCKPFNEYGLAVVENSRNDFAIIDSSGEEVIRPGDIFSIEEVTSDVTVVQLRAGRDGYKLYLVPERRALDIIFPYMGKFTGGLAATSIKDKRGYITVKGEPWLMGKFDNACSFSEGLGLVRKGDKYGYINPEGKVVIPFRFDYGYDFSEGRARVQNDGKTGYIDKAGNFVIPCKYDDIHFAVGNFRDGAVVVKLDKKFGTIDTLGNTLIPMEYESLFYSGEGVYEAKKNGEEILTDRTGKVILKNDFDYFSRFIEGWAMVTRKKTGNFIDKNGRYLLPACPGFEVLENFDHGYALCRRNGTKFYIDKKGMVYCSRPVVPYQDVLPEYMPRLAGYEIIENYNGCLIAKKDGLFSVLDGYNGNKFLPGNFMSYEIVAKEKYLFLKDVQGNNSFYQGKVVPVDPVTDKFLRQAAQLEDLAKWYDAFRDSAVSERKTKSIAIGKQVWAAEDLKVRTFRNGDTIYRAPWPPDFIKASDKKIPALYIGYPDNKFLQEKEATYLYNRYALTDKRGLLPAGYRVPDTTDWRELANTAYGDSVAVGLLSRIGFKNLGYLLVVDGEGGFSPNTLISSWWSAESLLPGYSFATMFISAFGGMVKFNGLANGYGVPIRCIKGNAPLKKSPPQGINTKNK